MHGYFRCIAASVQGDHGVEVAISKHCHFAVDDDGKKCFVEREQISIVSSDSRCIVVRLCNAAVDFYVCVCVFCSCPFCCNPPPTLKSGGARSLELSSHTADLERHRCQLPIACC